MVFGGTVAVDGRFENRKSKDRASSRSLSASIKVGYLCLMIWSSEILGVLFFSYLAASPTSPLPRDFVIFLARALWSLNLLMRGS